MVPKKCLNEDILTSYLEGLLDAPVRTATEQHLVGCDECRSRLVLYMRILDEEVLEEEDSVVQAAMERWGKQSVVVRQQHGSLSTKWLAIAAMMLIAISVGLFVSVDRRAVPTPDEIIELLLSTERPPFEARLSEQPYRPLFATRGEEGLDFARDPLEAEMFRQAASAHRMGLFYLLDEDFDQAIEYLEEAARQLVDNPIVQNDLGVAYLEKGGASEDELAVDRRRARAQFEEALSQDPEFVPAVYNLTLLFIRLDLFAEAQAQHDRYLTLDPDSEWADEIRRWANPN